jgi:hypothetical protein
MGGSFWLVTRIVAILLGAAALLFAPPPAWVDTAYANGIYPVWQRAIAPISGAFPWSLGDLAGLLAVGLIVWRVVALRDWRALVDALAILALFAVWFEVAWGWNYQRSPVETRMQYDAARVNPQAADALRARAMAEMNALAPAAHARASEPLDLGALAFSWTPVVRRAGNDWTPIVSAPKPTIADPFMNATGTSGFINPFFLTVQLASDLLWFERPFALSHEWSHVAAYAREDEANYFAILTCLRSKDPAVRYSGWFELFTYLPPKAHYERSDFVPLVWEDFRALQERNARHINVSLAHFSWGAYNQYLKTNRIAAGVTNYDEVTRLMLGIPLDGDGLPVARAATPR